MNSEFIARIKKDIETSDTFEIIISRKEAEFLIQNTEELVKAIKEETISAVEKLIKKLETDFECDCKEAGNPDCCCNTSVNEVTYAIEKELARWKEEVK